MLLWYWDVNLATGESAAAGGWFRGATRGGGASPGKCQRNGITNVTFQVGAVENYCPNWG